jgi:hypothetical protein
VTALKTTGSDLMAALEQTWADIRRRTPELPEVVVVTGTGLSSSALHIDAKWGHFGADHWVEGRPTEEGQGAALDLSAARRRPELFVAGECLAEGPRQTLQTMLHEAVHAPTEQTVADYADTLAYLGRPSGCIATPSPLGSARRPRPRRGPGWSGWRRPAAERQDRGAVQGRLRLPAAPVVLVPGQAVHPRTNHLRRLRPRLPTPGRRPPVARWRTTRLAGVKPQRRSGFGPDWPRPRPVRAPSCSAR